MLTRRYGEQFSMIWYEIRVSLLCYGNVMEDWNLFLIDAQVYETKRIIWKNDLISEIFSMLYASSSKEIQGHDDYQSG